MQISDFFTSSPFTLTANRETAACWAGRKDIATRLTRLCNSFVARSDSSLDLIWANLGSGKSHALFHLQFLLESLEDYQSKVVTAYVEMPEQLRKFHDLYRRVVTALPLDTVLPLVAKAPKTVKNHNLLRASQAFTHGSNLEKTLAVDWITGERPDLRELRRAAAIDSRIESDSVACDVLSDLVAAANNNSIRVLLLLDEFQRVSILKEPVRNAVLSNVRSVFSRNPANFSVVLAVGSRIEQNAMNLLPRELRTLMSIRPTISLPEMDQEEALEFTLDRLLFFRPAAYKGDRAAPFGIEAIKHALHVVASHDSAKLIPRTILQVLALLFDHIAQEKPGKVLEPNVVEDLLKDIRWDME